MSVPVLRDGSDAQLAPEQLLYRLLKDLTVALGRVSLVQRSPDLPQRARMHLRDAQAAIERAATEGHGLQRLTRRTDD